MFTIYYGPSMTDLQLAVPQGTPVFENIFPSDSFYTFAECWALMDDNIHPCVICRTTDAILASPESAKIVRVGRSAAFANKGDLVTTPLDRVMFRAMHR